VVDTVDSRIQYIYEPVQEGMDRVVDTLRGLARKAGVPTEGGLLDHVVGGGGKKLRPALTLLSAGFHPHQPEPSIIMATAVELLHIASLVHDDTVDDSSVRRGRATVNKLWGGKVAVLLGDYIFATSATFVCDTGNVRVIRRFSETIMELAKGEMSEHFSTHDWHQSIADYEERTYNKTASLFCTASECGAVLSGAPDSTSQALLDYGYNLGMAFQIADDILDFQGTEAELGKPVGNDLLQGTLTLPALLFAQRHPDEPVIQRLRNGGTDLEDLGKVVEMVRNSPVIAETLTVADRYRGKALDSLKHLEANRSRSSLEELINYITARRT
jgi:octaprenyl-diphosphate synthase